MGSPDLWLSTPLPSSPYFLFLGPPLLTQGVDRGGVGEVDRDGCNLLLEAIAPISAWRGGESSRHQTAMNSKGRVNKQVLLSI